MENEKFTRFERLIIQPLKGTILDNLHRRKDILSQEGRDYFLFKADPSEATSLEDVLAMARSEDNHSLVCLKLLNFVSKTATRKFARNEKAHKELINVRSLVKRLISLYLRQSKEKESKRAAPGSKSAVKINDSILMPPPAAPLISRLPLPCPTRNCQKSKSALSMLHLREKHPASRLTLYRTNNILEAYFEDHDYDFRNELVLGRKFDEDEVFLYRRPVVNRSGNRGFSFLLLSLRKSYSYDITLKFRRGSKTFEVQKRSLLSSQLRNYCTLFMDERGSHSMSSSLHCFMTIREN